MRFSFWETRSRKTSVAHALVAKMARERICSEVDEPCHAAYNGNLQCTAIHREVASVEEKLT
jgi:hypothetical protein